MVRNVVLIALAAAFVFMFRTAEVDGMSMYPTFEDNDFLIMVRSSNVTYGDVVAVWSESLQSVLCKRVVALAGDVVAINQDGLFLNGEKVDEPYIDDTEWADSTPAMVVLVPDNSVFVLGDNRSESIDSRRLGTFQTDEVRWKVIINVTKSLGVGRVEVLATLLCAVVALEWRRKHVDNSRCSS